jgi:phosphatidylserine/phosphatidylglycerophosphate/cardiolipin synthase-like enzyme
MTLLKPLAESMDSNPNLKARLILNISRNRNDTTDSAQLVAQFRNEFTKRTWPGDRLPELWYFPQALEMDWKTRASLHSKVIIVDRRRLFISSANLTDAAQDKNIETGVILDSPKNAERIANYFESLADRFLLKRM